MLGNVLEWVIGHDGKPVTRGGSFKDGSGSRSVMYMRVQKNTGNGMKPTHRYPKSKWWLSDGYFVGFQNRT